VSIPEAPILDPAASAQRATKFRWVICGLLFYATTVNYIDRSIFGVLAADLQKAIGWRDYQYGLINAAFTLAYAIGFVLMGWLIDTVGTRIGYAIALSIWSFAGVCTSFAKSAAGFGAARFGLGIGEAGNFPAAIKTTAEWFPQKQRATATGVFNAGSNVGAILAPFLVPFVVIGWGLYRFNTVRIASGLPAISSADAAKPEYYGDVFRYGWPAAFFITPILAAIWIGLWLTLYRTPSKSRFPNQAELDFINSDSVAPAAAADPAGPPPPKVKWIHLLPHRQTWAFALGKFLTDPIWWFYLFWAGKFFSDTFGVNLKGLAGPLILIYVLADVGSIAGGWLSSNLIRRGWTPNAARKTAMSICAGLILPVIMAPLIPPDWKNANINYGMWMAATLIGIAAAAHQGFSANIFTTTSDMFPKRAISSVVGLGGLAGALGGMIMQAVAGVIKEVTGSYVVMFIIAGTVYVLAVGVIHLLAPKLARVTDEEFENATMPRLVTAALAGVMGFVIGVPLSYFFQSKSLSLSGLPKDFGANVATLPADILAKAHAAATHGFTFPEYAANVISGDIFKSLDHASLVPILVWTPVIAAATGVVLGAAVHGLIYRRRQTA